MKTGTGAEWRKGYHANYVGVAPWPNPVVAFSIRITHEPTSSRVNRTAREVLVALLEGLKLRSTSLRGEGRLEERLHPLL
jgi:cell division protein FtsI/penicillin-binding protein 2